MLLSMTNLVRERQRLDSWKAIAKYLQRDLATVRRWEKGLGLPVHRVGGAGRSVFAYTTEIDAWLETRTPITAVHSVDSVVAIANVPFLIQSWPWLLIVASAFLIGWYAKL
jgi:hypothetical protein